MKRTNHVRILPISQHSGWIARKMNMNAHKYEGKKGIIVRELRNVVAVKMNDNNKRVHFLKEDVAAIYSK